MMEPVPKHLQEIWEAIHDIQETQVTQQEELDVITAAITQVGTELEADQKIIQAEIDKVGEVVSADLGPLRAAVDVDALGPKAEALGTLVPEKPVPPAAPAAEPVAVPPTETPAVEPTPVQVVSEPSPSKSVYTFTPAEGVDARNDFTPSGLQTADGAPLFFFDGDEALEENGHTIPGYTVYRGATKLGA